MQFLMLTMRYLKIWNAWSKSSYRWICLEQRFLPRSVVSIWKGSVSLLLSFGSLGFIGVPVFQHIVCLRIACPYLLSGRGNYCHTRQAKSIIFSDKLEICAQTLHLYRGAHKTVILIDNKLRKSWASKMTKYRQRDFHFQQKFH